MHEGSKKIVNERYLPTADLIDLHQSKMKFMMGGGKKVVMGTLTQQFLNDLGAFKYLFVKKYS